MFIVTFKLTVSFAVLSLIVNKNIFLMTTYFELMTMTTIRGLENEKKITVNFKLLNIIQG